MKFDNNIIAHRGVFNNQEIPENSLKSFQKAVSYNYPIELDVQLTVDNQLVVFHDFDLKRMTSKEGRIQDKTLKELKKCTLLSTQEQIPTLKEVLNFVQGKVPLLIEIKNTNRISDTCSILMKELENYSSYVLESFDPRIVRYLKKHFPNVQVGLLFHNKYNHVYEKMLFSSNLIFTYCHPDFLAISKKILLKKRFQKLKQKYPIYLWTIQKKEEISDDNYTYICNNLPYEK